MEEINTKETRTKRALTMQELRSMMPKKLNAYGKWFFSEDNNKFNIEVHDMIAVLR